MWFAPGWQDSQWSTQTIFEMGEIPQQVTTMQHHPNSLHFFSRFLNFKVWAWTWYFTLFTLMSPSGSPDFTLWIFQSQTSNNTNSNLGTLTSPFNFECDCHPQNGLNITLYLVEITLWHLKLSQLFVNAYTIDLTI